MSKLFTIGYEGSDIDQFVSTLKTFNINVLADVRAVPISRKRGFSKNALRARLEAEGISYCHFSTLGDPKPGREAARAGRISEFKVIYSMHINSIEADQALSELGAMATTKNCCLLCFERDPTLCHRSIVAGKLQRFGLETQNLYCDAPTKHVRTAKKFTSHDPGKGAAPTQ